VRVLGTGRGREIYIYIYIGNSSKKNRKEKKRDIYVIGDGEMVPAGEREKYSNMGTRREIKIIKREIYK
jgi:hypothetical protein